jgi:hypothetical protein
MKLSHSYVMMVCTYLGEIYISEIFFILGCVYLITGSSRVEGGWGGMASPLGIKMVKTIPLMKWPSFPSPVI